MCKKCSSTDSCSCMTRKDLIKRISGKNVYMSIQNAQVRVRIPHESVLRLYDVFGENTGVNGVNKVIRVNSSNSHFDSLHLEVKDI